MDPTKLSKTMSYILRHHPESAGLTCDSAGWVNVQDLLRGLRSQGHQVKRSDIEQVVQGNDKKRFTLSENGQRIRAAQGHSFKVDLGLEIQIPPDTLYHGTPRRSLDSIFEQGLKPMKRHAVHLSPDTETASAVGARRGKFVVLKIDTGQMHKDGHVFTRSENGVWLTDHVPSSYISFNS
jgi:putative RNA 2'-phosphotransferase